MASQITFDGKTVGRAHGQLQILHRLPLLKDLVDALLQQSSQRSPEKSRGPCVPDVGSPAGRSSSRGTGSREQSEFAGRRMQSRSARSPAWNPAGPASRSGPTRCSWIEATIRLKAIVRSAASFADVTARGKAVVSSGLRISLRVAAHQRAQRLTIDLAIRLAKIVQPTTPKRAESKRVCESLVSCARSASRPDKSRQSPCDSHRHVPGRRLRVVFCRSKRSAAWSVRAGRSRSVAESVSLPFGRIAAQQVCALNIRDLNGANAWCIAHGMHHVLAGVQFGRRRSPCSLWTASTHA